MSADEAALIPLWQEKWGVAEPADLSGDLIVQLGVATEGLNRNWYERNTGRSVTEVQRWVQHPVHRYLAATLDGFVNDLDAVFEAKFMLPWSFSEEAAAEKHMAQLQHNMWVTNARSAALSIITGGGKWIEMTIPADALYQHFLVTAERRFWRCVQTGEMPGPLWRRAASATDRRSSHSRHERVQFVGGVRWPLLRHALRLSRSREGQVRAQGPAARGRQGSLRPRRSSQAIEVGRGQL
jgi:predicted phage-related endonuclease